MIKRERVLVETSGRDVGMFSYIDHFFDDDSYRKLALNFEIDDITFAEASVDRRMAGEMERGRSAVESGDAGRVVDANQGGPYGSAVLAGVQAASRETWQRIVNNEADGVGASWYKAAFRITPHADEPWTLAADVDGATAFEFTPQRRRADPGAEFARSQPFAAVGAAPSWHLPDGVLLLVSYLPLAV